MAIDWKDIDGQTRTEVGGLGDAGAKVAEDVTPTRGLVSFADLEAQLTAHGQISWGELEVPVASTRGLVSFSELQEGTDQRGLLAFAELETLIAGTWGAQPPGTATWEIESQGIEAWGRQAEETATWGIQSQEIASWVDQPGKEIGITRMSIYGGIGRPYGSFAGK